MADENFTDEELASMTDDEREALGLESDDANDDAAEGSESEVADENEMDDDAEHDDDLGETGESDVDDDADDNDHGDADSDSEGVDGSEQDEKPEPEPEPEPTAEVQPEQDTDDAAVSPQDRIEEIDKELEALGEKVEEGEIDFKEYNQSMLKLTQERQNLVVDLRDQQNAATQRASDWASAVDKFLEADPGHKVVVDNPIIKQAFEAALVQVVNSPEGRSQSDEWRLNKAKDVMAESGITIGTVKAEKAPEKPSSRKPNVDIPKTLSEVPAAGDNDNSEFSHLAGLSGTDLEEALAKMTPDQERRYLEG